jgi:hypothetical protein
MMKKGATTTSTVPGDSSQEFPTAQLEDELVLMGGRDVMVSAHGLEAHSDWCTPLGTNPLLSPNKISLLVLDCLGAKSPLCI